MTDLQTSTLWYYRYTWTEFRISYSKTCISNLFSQTRLIYNELICSFLPLKWKTDFLHTYTCALQPRQGEITFLFSEVIYWTWSILIANKPPAWHHCANTGDQQMFQNMQIAFKSNVHHLKPMKLNFHDVTAWPLKCTIFYR